MMARLRENRHWLKQHARTAEVVELEAPARRCPHCKRHSRCHQRSNWRRKRSRSSIDTNNARHRTMMGKSPKNLVIATTTKVETEAEARARARARTRAVVRARKARKAIRKASDYIEYECDACGQHLDLMKALRQAQ